MERPEWRGQNGGRSGENKGRAERPEWRGHSGEARRWVTLSATVGVNAEQRRRKALFRHLTVQAEAYSSAVLFIAVACRAGTNISPRIVDGNTTRNLGSLAVACQTPILPLYTYPPPSRPNLITLLCCASPLLLLPSWKRPKNRHTLFLQTGFQTGLSSLPLWRAYSLVLLITAHRFFTARPSSLQSCRSSNSYLHANSLLTGLD